MADASQHDAAPGGEHSADGAASATSTITPIAMPPLDDLQAVARLREAYEQIRAELSKVIVGQELVIDELLIALFARGHVILEGVPGLAKTLLIGSLAKCLGLEFHRIQFTPDLMPSDITGTEVIQEDRRTGQRSFRFLKGPIFANVLLADEINRTPPKTQAALLEAMQEYQVTVGGVRHPLDPPFFVLATQNPIEQEGTYPLPEAQQDRFMFKIHVGYPSYEEEYLIAERTTGETMPEIRPVLTQGEILRLQEVVRKVPTAPSVIQYALDVVRATRPDAPDARGDGALGGARSETSLGATRTAARGGTAVATTRAAPADALIQRLVTFGAGPRAVQFLLLGAKARAVMFGRKHVATEDVRAIANPVLRHRIITNYAAEAEGYTADRIIAHVLGQVTTREGSDGGLREIRKA